MNTVNKITNPWIRPWNTRKFNDLYNRDERFFSVLLKGTIAYLNSHIKMYDKSINHFIFNTGSSYMYVESNGYEFNWNETTGEDTMYMELPRCVVEMGNIDVPQEELSQPFARGNYERKEDDKIKGFNAEIKRIPIELSLDLHYVFSNFNEGIIVMQELFDELIFQRYFNIVYLGQIVQCSIEFTNSYTIELNKIDLGAAEQNVRNLNIQVKICSNYPVINEKTEISVSKIISKFSGFINKQGRDENIEILIDGVKSDINDIYIDLRKYDINNDGIISDDEITLIQEFIDKFDIDRDSQVSTYDINIIIEEFQKQEYNIKYDILNKGHFDIENLLVIKELFNALDINHDNIIDQQEIDGIVSIIDVYKNFDIDGDLKIDYKDVNNIITYIINHKNLTYSELYEIVKKFIEENLTNEELITFIFEIIENDLDNFKLAIEYFLKNNDIQIDQQTLKDLFSHLTDLLNFKIYDFNNDGVLDENDIHYMLNLINSHVEHEITYYVNSGIIIHMNDHGLSDDSITDKISYRTE